jgi:hypothetical protein
MLHKQADTRGYLKGFILNKSARLQALHFLVFSATYVCGDGLGESFLTGGGDGARGERAGIWVQGWEKRNVSRIVVSVFERS